MLKWGFMRTFPGNQDAKFKYHFYKILLVFELPYQSQVKGMPG